MLLKLILGNLGGLSLAKIFSFSRTQILHLSIKRVAFDGLGFVGLSTLEFCEFVILCYVLCSR